MSSIINYNPDILTCLANLSNDEVFTPPEVANAVLEMIPSEFWSDPNVKVLDPAVKSGVFLREAAKRFIKGLEDKIPDLQKRIDHIMHNQLYGMAITELTGHMARRTVYCSKRANGPYSVSMFEGEEQGNILYYPCKHTWKGNRCSFCGASETLYNRGDEFESYAYEFIHLTDKQLKDYNMKFDLIISNPPYQLNDGGGVGTSALPVYNKFVEQAKKLTPKYLTMIIPSRWFTGGRGLDEFRDMFLHDHRLQIIHDYPNATDCFPGVEIKGGVCYFLWNHNYSGDCNIFTHINGVVSKALRPLLEKDMQTFIRYNKMVTILHKVRAKREETFDLLVSANDPFGFDIREQDSYKRIKPQFKLTQSVENSIKFYYNGWRKNGIGYISESIIRKGNELLNKKKLFIPKAWGTGSPESDWLNPIIPEGNSCCTETYLVIGPLNTDEELNNVYLYTQTKFFHAMVSIIKITQNTMKKAYSLVPIQDFSKPWTDEELYKKYGLTEDEINFIESMIKPMDLEG